MFESLLIANRGEIACRVIRTARRLGIRTIAVYSDADADAMHVEQADQAVRIGPAPAAHSYLNQDALLRAVAESRAAALHPGYGFLSENADFAAAVEAAGAAFVGPPPAAIRDMASKIEAKRLVAAAGAPVVPGCDGAEQSAEALARRAADIGYPVLIKASLGGGGKGMRIVVSADDFAAALAGAKREAGAAFGDDTVLLERYLENPKHIEIQILADARGKTLHLFERDCSVQRRHQKVIEEAPAPSVGADTRRAMSEAAIRAARAVGYVGAGTVEFIATDDAFYFLEMNTRLQVEHPVTEAILGLDLVEWQLRIAAGESLPFAQEDLAVRGHAVEARVYAENVKASPGGRIDFLPSAGTLRRFDFPAGVRVDTGVGPGSAVTAHYDPMLAKVIAHGADRRQAVAALRDALRRSEIAGVEHNVAWLVNVLGHPRFVSGAYTTALAEEAAADLAPGVDPAATAAAVVSTLLANRGDDPWSLQDAFQANLPHEQTVPVRRRRKRFEVRVLADGADFTVDGPDGAFRLEEAQLRADGVFRARLNGRWIRLRIVQGDGVVFVVRDGATTRLDLIERDAGTFGRATEKSGRIVAPMPGQIVSVAVSAGERVREGQVLAVLEAMKMEHSIRAVAAGTVRTVHCAPGDRVVEGAELVRVEPG